MFDVEARNTYTKIQEKFNNLTANVKHILRFISNIFYEHPAKTILSISVVVKYEVKWL